MSDLATRGLRRTEKFGRLGPVGADAPARLQALMWCTFSGVPLPPPFREAQKITLALDEAVNDVLDDRLAHPTESADLLNVLFAADNGTWPRKRVRDEALTFMLAGHETTANAMSWLWYLLAGNPDARQRMLAEIDDVLGAPSPTAADLTPAAVDHRLHPGIAALLLGGVDHRRVKRSRTTSSTGTTSARARRC